LYAYASGNPISLKDPDGRCVEDLCIGETIAVVEVGEALWGAAAVALAAVDGAIASTMVKSSDGEDDTPALPPAVSNTGDPGAAPSGPGGFCEQGNRQQSKRFTPDQSALIDLAQEAQQLGGGSPEEA